MTVTAPAAVAWHRGPLLGFDLETSGIDVANDRIVTAAIIRVMPGQPPMTATWLANPGVEIPAGATEVHGITNERAQAEGRNPAVVLSEITEMLEEAIEAGTPIVGMNLVFDLTLLRSECLRHGILPVNPAPVIDVRVLDKAADPYRKGGRKLADLCQAYGVKLDAAHDAGGDALGALRVAWAIAQRYPELQIEPHALHERQIRWAAAQTASFADYRRRKGEPLDDESGDWPVRSLPEVRETTSAPSA